MNISTYYKAYVDYVNSLENYSEMEYQAEVPALSGIERLFTITTGPKSKSKTVTANNEIAILECTLTITFMFEPTKTLSANYIDSWDELEEIEKGFLQLSDTRGEICDINLMEIRDFPNEEQLKNAVINFSLIFQRNVSL